METLNLEIQPKKQQKQKSKPIYKKKISKTKKKLRLKKLQCTYKIAALCYFPVIFSCFSYFPMSYAVISSDKEKVIRIILMDPSKTYCKTLFKTSVN